MFITLAPGQTNSIIQFNKQLKYQTGIVHSLSIIVDYFTGGTLPGSWGFDCCNDSRYSSHSEKESTPDKIKVKNRGGGVETCLMYVQTGLYESTW